jgi:hypothetical protein
MGVAVMGSLINSTLTSELATNIPQPVREQAPPDLLERLGNPQFLLSPQQLAAVRNSFEGLGPQGAQLYEASIGAVRASLATAITEAFWIAMVFTIVAVLVGVFLKELPLRQVMDIEGQPFAEPAEGAPAAAPIPPVAGGSDGADHQPAS